VLRTADVDGALRKKHFGNAAQNSLFPSLPHAIPYVKNKPDENEESIKMWSIISSLPNKICQNFDKGEVFF
jgi:hypothetical protein